MVRTVLLGVAIVVSGCGRAIVMTRSQYGGVIQLDGDHSKGMEEANQRMAEHCGANNYTIVQEGWEQVGTQTTTTTTTGATAEEVQTQQVTTTAPENKWRVHYQCNTASQQQVPAAVPAAAPPPMTPPPPSDPAALPPPPPPN